MARALPAPRKRPVIQEQVYLWEGKDKAGKTVRGEMRAGGEALVQAQLRRQGVRNVKLRKQAAGKVKRISEKDISLFTRQLATMMKSGVPLLQAFDIVAKGASNPSVARLLTDVRQEVETGSSLSQAFRKHPKYFDPLYCNLIAAGEQAGILDTLLDRLATYREKTLALKAKIKSALFYPAAVIAVAVIITAVIMIFVIPAFKDMFSNFGADLPAPTLLVMAISDFFVQWWYAMLIGAVAGGMAIAHSYKKSEAMRAAVDRGSLKAPIFGSVIRKATVARWARTLSTMFAAGVPLVEALDSVGGAAGNHVYKTATKDIQKAVATGTSLTVAMQDVRVFDSMVIQMCAIGEESGQLDNMLSKVADFYEREVDDAVASLSSLMEPIIMVVLGTVIGGMVVAMYLPIFKMAAVV